MTVHPKESATSNQKRDNRIEHPIPEKTAPQIVGVKRFVLIVVSAPSPDDAQQPWADRYKLEQLQPRCENSAGNGRRFLGVDFERSGNYEHAIIEVVYGRRHNAFSAKTGLGLTRLQECRQLFDCGGFRHWAAPPNR
jgi:hypothetical protein